MTEKLPDWVDDLDEAAEQAEKFGEKPFFGKLDVEIGYIHWIDSQPTEVTSDEYKNLPDRDKNLEIRLSIDIQEFAPHLEFPYERKMRVGDSDWHQIFRPSVEAITGKGTMAKGKYGKTVHSLKGKYVKGIDVAQVKNEAYNTIKLAQIYKSREECLADHQERFGSNEEDGASTSSSGVPDSYTAESWANTVPHIQTALKEGQPPAKLAIDYAVPVETVIALQE